MSAERPTDDALDPTILHLDRHLVVAAKPSGLLSVPGIGPEKADCLVSRLARDVSGVRIVHRLDRDTSGVIVLARDADTHRALSMQFERRLTEKTYVALAAGHPHETSGTIDLPLRKQSLGSALQIVDHDLGRPSITSWRVLDRLTTPRCSRFEVRPLTGRSHQIRVHLMSIGHPILGDELYAPPEIHALSPRLCLHAQGLVFQHPHTGERMEWTSPPPF